MRVYIIATGICSALGDDTETHFQKLCSGTTGIKTIDDRPLLQKSIKAGAYHKSNQLLYQELSIDENEIIPRTALMGLVAAREALHAIDDVSRIQLFNATTVGGMDRSEIFYSEYYNHGDESKLNHLAMHDCGEISFWMSEKLGFEQCPMTISSACSSSANSIMIAADSIRSGKNELALAGGSDALSDFTINGFSSLMIYDQEFCRPFDQNRQGLNLGEGSAYLTLASEAYVQEHNITPLAEFKSGANTNDVFHQTASSPDATGAKLAIKTALKKAQLQASAIGYVNAHGTATENNDATEQKAIESIFPADIKFSSTKGFTGHTLAAAGAIEAVFATLALQHQTTFANIHCSEPISNDIRPIVQAESTDIDYVLSNSFGFGGNSTSLIFGAL